MLVILIAMPTPGPGTVVATSNDLLWEQQAIQITNDMLAKGYTKLAAEWKTFYPAFHAAHPQMSVSQVLSEFVGVILSGGLASGISDLGSFVASGLPRGIALNEKAVIALSNNPFVKLGAGLETAAGAAVKTITNPLDFLGGISDFFQRLTEPQTWVRVGEFVVGAMLIYVGIKAVVTPGGAGAAVKTGVKGTKDTGTIAGSVFRKLTPTGRATSVLTRHEQRVTAAKTRQRAQVVRGKQKQFGRKELYR